MTRFITSEKRYVMEKMAQGDLEIDLNVGRWRLSVPSAKRLPRREPVGEPAICREQLVKYIPFTSLPAQHSHY